MFVKVLSIPAPIPSVIFVRILDIFGPALSAIKRGVELELRQRRERTNLQTIIMVSRKVNDSWKLSQSRADSASL